MVRSSNGDIIPDEDTSNDYYDFLIAQPIRYSSQRSVCRHEAGRPEILRIFPEWLMMVSRYGEVKKMAKTWRHRPEWPRT